MAPSRRKPNRLRKPIPRKPGNRENLRSGHRRDLCDGVPICPVAIHAGTGPLQYALYPHIAAIRDDKAKVTSLFLLLTRVLAMVIIPSVGIVAVASEPIFHLLLSKKWGEAIPVFDPNSPRHGVATGDGDHRHVSNGAGSYRRTKTSCDAIRFGVARWASGSGLVWHRSRRGHVYHLRDAVFGVVTTSLLAARELLPDTLCSRPFIANGANGRRNTSLPNRKFDLPEP